MAYHSKSLGSRMSHREVTLAEFSECRDNFILCDKFAFREVCWFLAVIAIYKILCHIRTVELWYFARWFYFITFDIRPRTVTPNTSPLTRRIPPMLRQANSSPLTASKIVSGSSSSVPAYAWILSLAALLVTIVIYQYSLPLAITVDDAFSAEIFMLLMSHLIYIYSAFLFSILRCWKRTAFLQNRLQEFWYHAIRLRYHFSLFGSSCLAFRWFHTGAFRFRWQLIPCSDYYWLLYITIPRRHPHFECKLAPLCILFAGFRE